MEGFYCVAARRNVAPRQIDVQRMPELSKSRRDINPGQALAFVRAPESSEVTELQQNTYQ